MSSDIFNIVVMIILFFGVLISFFGFFRQRWMDRLEKQEGKTSISESKREEETKQLKAEIAERTKQYDELAEHVKLPKAVDKAITVEKNPDWGISHPYKDIIQNRRGVPYLQFYMRVINRTYYYFEPDKMVICCLFDNHKLCDEWNSEVKTKETNIEPDYLRECEDGTIIVRFPIKELYGNLRKWKLDGTVTYKLKGSVIKASKQYMHPKIGIHVEYELPDEQIKKLKEEVEKALGDKQ